jgi:hypothetical protein
VEKYLRAGQATDDNIICCLYIACCIPKTINTLTICIVLIACLVKFLIISGYHSVSEAVLVPSGEEVKEGRKSRSYVNFCFLLQGTITTQWPC